MTRNAKWDRLGAARERFARADEAHQETERELEAAREELVSATTDWTRTHSLELSGHLHD